MIASLSLKLVHLFPDHMNIYGDMGNIITLRKRCEWRGIHVQYVPVNTQSEFSLMEGGDLYFFGGGQDADQMRVWHEIERDITTFARIINTAVLEDRVFLLVCGGFQMFGKEFIDANGRSIPGLGVLDITTRTPGAGVANRCIGNIIVTHDLPVTPTTIVGFENHGGQTYRVEGSSQQARLLGHVTHGHGNTFRGKEEGYMYRNVVGTYLHGSLLPKNPHLADYLIVRALTARYQEDVVLNPLDDTLEMQAHNAVIRQIMR